MTRGEHAVNEKPAAPAGWDGLGGGDGETPIPSTELEEGEGGGNPGRVTMRGGCSKASVATPSPFSEFELT